MANYVLLERITVGAAGASSVTFNNIPQTGYTDLKVVVSAKGTDSAARGMLIAFNGSSSTFSGKYLIGDGSSPSSGSLAQYVGSIFGTGGTANTFNNTEIYIPNYLGSQQKSFSVDNVAENNGSTGYANIIAGLWATTSAISSINLSIQVGSFIQYSTFSLYALAAVGTTPTKAPKAIGGDIVQYDGTYWYHAFINSGSFIPQIPLSCDVLVVAGGGGGGSDAGGGGGAGGVLAFASQALISSTGYTATIGAGGAQASSATIGYSGSNSQFASLTASVGGGAGSTTTSPAGTGGSGGGGGRNGGQAGGSATSGQGNAGGTGTLNTSGGGGGGAGGAGSNSSSTGGTGGAGTNSVTNWGALSAALTATGLGVSGYLAGGGAGGPSGTAGTGGGGAGGATANPGNGTAGTPNTGSGGGGGGGGYGIATNGAAGGSGVVIVRYLA